MGSKKTTFNLKVRKLHADVGVGDKPMRGPISLNDYNDGGFAGWIDVDMVIGGLVIALQDVKILLTIAGGKHFSVQSRTFTPRGATESITIPPWKFVTAEDHAEFVKQLFAIPAVETRFATLKALYDARAVKRAAALAA
jgi:hypothetical protein